MGIAWRGMFTPSDAVNVSQSTSTRLTSSCLVTNQNPS